jgi:integrase
MKKRISFHQRNGYIHCRAGGLRFTTRIKLPPGNTLKKSIVIGPDSPRLNESIQELKKIIRQRIDNGIPIKAEDNFHIDVQDPTVFGYARLVTDKILKDEILSKSGRPYSTGSKMQWRNFCSTLNKFAQDIRLLDLDVSGDFKQKKIASDLAKSYFNSLRLWMASNGYMITTQTMIIEKLKILFSYAEDEYMIHIDKKFRYYKEEVPIVVIPPEVVKSFLNSSIPDDVELRYAYEISSVILVSSLRISDVLSLTIDDLSSGCIVSTNKKTGANTKSPIPDRVYQMLLNNHRKYGRLYSLNHTRNITDRILSIRMPELFKDIATERVSISRMLPDGSGYEKIVKPLNEFIRPHMLRKSAITSMIVSGVPERFVKHLSGHRGNSRSFERYVAYVEKEYNDSIKTYQNKLMNG